MKKLKFLKTWSIEDFKKEQEISEIQVMRSNKTGKCFFLYGNQSGACCEKILSGGITNPVISEVCSENSGDSEKFLLLHQKGELKGSNIGVL